MKNGLWGVFFKVFGDIVDNRTLYKEIKSNEEAKKVSVVMAKKSIIYSIAFLLTAAISFGLIFWGLSLFGSLAVVLGIILVIMGVLIGIYALIYLPLALSTLIRQFTLNKKPLTWVALVLLIVILVGLIVGGILVATL